MLFRYNGKIYIKPFANKIVEVKVTKKGNEYTVEPTNNSVELTREVENNLYSVSIEEAYKFKSFSKNISSLSED